ncbi:MAG: hypothetical protein Q4D65_03025 [Peptostreptococcaceae bacterium]|nr:hypothetical protein [Peptostreptococcaceae bacterium]
MKVSTREKMLISIVALLLLAALYFNYYLLPQKEEINSLRAERDQKQERKIMMEEKLADSRTLDQEYIASKNGILKMSNKFFSEVEQEEFILLINDLADEANVVVNQIDFEETAGTDAITSFQEGREKLDKYTELIAQNKIKGYVKKDLAVIPGEEEKKEEDSDSVKVSSKMKKASKLSSETEQNTNRESENTEPNTSENPDGQIQGDEAQNQDTNRTPENIQQSEDPNAVTYANNIRALVATVQMDGSYDEIHEFVSLIAQSERNIIVENIKISTKDKGTTSKSNVSELRIVFYKVVGLEDYFSHKDSVLVNAVVTKSQKASPFMQYSWSFKPTSPTSSVATNQLGNQITLPQQSQSVIPPFVVYPSTPSYSTPMPAPTPAPGGTYVPSTPTPNSVPGDMSYTPEYERLSWGGYVKRDKPSVTPNVTPQLPEVVPSNVIPFDNLSGLKLQLNSNGTKNSGSLKLSDKSGLSKEVMSLDYHLGEVGYYGAIRIDLTDKNIKLNQKTTDIILKVKSEMMSGHDIGLEILDADNNTHRVVLYEDIDWTDWKDVRVLNLPRISYPATVKSIYVSRVEDARVTDAKLYFDSLSYTYK